MTPTRRIWALSALALTLVLGACSTAPKDAAATTLEAQFGSTESDIGGDVAIASNGSIIVLSRESGYGYFEDSYNSGDEVYTNYEKLFWNRYDKSGKLIRSSELSSNDCANEDHNYEGCYMQLTAKALQADAKGFTYALASFSFSALYDYYGEDFTRYDDYVVYKVDATGKVVKHIFVGYNDSWGVDAVDMAVDAGGNIYIAKVETDDNTGDTKNVVAKYSTTGSSVWQRSSTVGAPSGISVASNGSIFVAGSTGTAKYTSNGNLVWTKSGEAFEAATSGTNVYLRNYKTPTVRKLDANGKQLWSKTQSGLSNIVIGAMAADASGNVYLTGKYNASSSNRNIFTRKLNSSGKVLWTKTLGTSAYDDARGIATLNGSDIYITGATQGALAHPYKGGANDGYIAKLNSGGNPVWKR